MFLRGSGSGEEYKRQDNTFYRGIVVKNNDPLKRNRVKVYIAELTNQPYDGWFQKFEKFILKSPGENSNPKTDSEKKTTGDWEDVTTFENMCQYIPWAEPCYPLMGESGNFRYWKDGEMSTVSDANYPEGLRVIDSDSPALATGGFSPAFVYEHEDTCMGDAFCSPVDVMCVNCNPYAFSYRSSKFVNKAKGMFGIPEVGSKVWVFHNEGDLSFPVYFGVYRDFRELTLINDTDNVNMISTKYPGDFEN